MALDLTNYICGGEIVNTRKNSVHGFLAVRDCDRSIILQLTGNCSAELAGKHFRFEAELDPARQSPPEAEAQLEELGLGWNQIGVPGEMSLGADPPRLCLEWHGQNGHTKVEIINPAMEFVDATAVDAENRQTDGAVDPQDADDDSNSEACDEAESPSESFEQGESEPWNSESSGDAPEDPFGLFPPDLEATLGGNSKITWNSEPDEATLAQWKEWDEVFDGTKDVPLSSLFDPPLQLPPSDTLDDQQVAGLFQTILAQLALYNVALHMCEHFDPRSGYDLLVRTILPENGTHPELPRIGYTMNFDTSEYCDECSAEFERRYGDDTSSWRQDDVGDDSDEGFRDNDVPF